MDAQVFNYILMGIIALCIFFIRSFYLDTRRTKEDLSSYKISTNEEIGKLRGKLDNIEQVSGLKFEQIHKDIVEVKTKLDTIIEGLNR